MKIVKRFLAKWKAETPVFWKWVRNTSLTVTTAIGSGILAVSSGGLSLPEHITTTLSIVLFVCGALSTVYAGTREKK